MYQWSWLSFGTLNSRCPCQTLRERGCKKLIRAVFEGVIAFCPQLFYYKDTSHYKFNLLLRLVDLVHLFSLDLQWSL